MPHIAAPCSAMIDGLSDSVSQGESGRSTHYTSLASIGLIVLSTVSGAAAQILLRFGADAIEGANLIGIITNVPLIGGYACLAVNVVLVVLALRGGQLSILYPIVALTFVWVAILSQVYFQDVISIPKIAGLTLIVAGVSFIGAGSRS
ncbi:MAG: hypothetical protein OXL36_01305 [Bryobacterales bacterium]|nr:hypothetical protein [Bryobacterales bacterium]